MTETRVGRVAYSLGFAGLLPSVVAIVLIALGERDPSDRAIYRVLAGYWLAMGYAGLILSFLGGTWWGIAMRRQVRQGRAVAISVTPSLSALLWLAVANPMSYTASITAAVGLGITIMLTPIIDRHFVATGEAPADWLHLRVPLSLGLGLLTIAAGVM